MKRPTSPLCALARDFWHLHSPHTVAPLCPCVSFSLAKQPHLPNQPLSCLSAKNFRLFSKIARNYRPLFALFFNCTKGQTFVHFRPAAERRYAGSRGFQPTVDDARRSDFVA